MRPQILGREAALPSITVPITVVVMVPRVTIAIVESMVVWPTEVPAGDDWQDGRCFPFARLDMAVVPATPCDGVSQQCKDSHVGGEEMHIDGQPLPGRPDQYPSQPRDGRGSQ